MKCDHCGSIHRVRGFNLTNDWGEDWDVHICYICASALMDMQKKLKEWVG